MATVGGDWLEIKVNHPTLGEHTFYPKSNEGSTFDPGGVRTNDDANQISSDRQGIWQKNIARGFIELTIANDATGREDWLFIKKLTASPAEGSYTCSHIGGSIWGFNGMPVGDIAPDFNTATMTIKIGISGDPNRLA